MYEDRYGPQPYNNFVDPSAVQRVAWFKQISKVTIPYEILELVGWLQQHTQYSNSYSVQDNNSELTQDEKVRLATQQKKTRIEGTLILFRKPSKDEKPLFDYIMGQLYDELSAKAQIRARKDKAAHILSLPDKPKKPIEELTPEELKQALFSYSTPEQKRRARFHLAQAEFDEHNLFVPYRMHAKACALFTSMMLEASTIAQQQLEFNYSREINSNASVQIGIDENTLKYLAENTD